MKASILTLLFFALVAALAHAEDDLNMEREILRELDQIQTVGESSWNFELKKKRLELEGNLEIQSTPKLSAKGNE